MRSRWWPGGRLVKEAGRRETEEGRAVQRASFLRDQERARADPAGDQEDDREGAQRPHTVTNVSRAAARASSATLIAATLAT